MSENFTVAMDEGRMDSLRGDRVLVDRTTADEKGWAVGDVLSATSARWEHVTWW